MISALTFGEILWDIIEGTPYIGGAPFNLAAHLSRMGTRVAMISALGDDDLGMRAYSIASEFAIDTRYISIHRSAPTGTVDVFLDDNGQPDYTIHDGTAWDDLALSPENVRSVANETWDVVCLGTLAQRSAGNRSLLAEVLAGTKAKHVFYDVNLRQDYYRREWIAESLGNATIVKLNDNEVGVLSRMFYNCDSESIPEMESFARRIVEQFALDTVLITLGTDGSMIYNSGKIGRAGCAEVEVVDTVGAGDSFSAGFLYSYLTGNRADISVEFASKVADFVVGQRGAIPAYSPELLADINRLEG